MSPKPISRVAHVGATLGAINFDDLRELYFDGTAADVAVREFDRVGQGQSSRDLGTLLRHHAQRAITSAKEIALRDAFDDVLAYYGLLEIACTLGYVNTPDAATFRSAVRLLGDDDVQTYYREHYPLLLPELFRRRAAGARDVVLPADQVHLPGFQRFLDLNAVIERSAEVAQFLALLDDYVVGDDDDETYGIDDLLTTLKYPRRVVRRLGTPIEQQDALDVALHGFRLFLRFCVGLDALLEALASFPLQQSLLWHHHAYWFECMRDQVGERLHEAVQRIAAWEASAAQSPDTRDAGGDQMHAVLRRLLSGRYGWVLREASDVSVNT